MLAHGASRLPSARLVAAVAEIGSLAIMSALPNWVTTMKKIIQLLSVCLLSLAAVAMDSSSPPVFQIRLVVDAPSDESEDMVVVDKTRAAGQKETLHVLKTVLIDQTAVESANVTKDKQFGDSQIEIRFTKDGKQRVAEVTRARVGKRLAFVIDGQLYSAPKVH